MKAECKAWTAGRIGYQTDKPVLQANAAIMIGQGMSSFVLFKNKTIDKIEDFDAVTCDLFAEIVRELKEKYNGKS